jgi:hypothetical protein
MGCVAIAAPRHQTGLLHGPRNATVKPMMRALLIRHPWIDMILDRKKTWEIRGSRTAIRETIGLIPSASSTVVGVCNVVDCVGPLSAEEFRRNARKAGMSRGEAELGYYRKTYAWVVEGARWLTTPVPYRHPPGAVIWVSLNDEVERAIREQL